MNDAQPSKLLPTTSPTEEQVWDGVNFTPQFAKVLLNFLNKNKATRSNSGFVTPPINQTAYAIAHGLGAKPTIISVSAFVTAAPSSTIPGQAFVSTTTPADATNIYVETGPTSVELYWAAAIV